MQVLNSTISTVPRWVIFVITLFSRRIGQGLRPLAERQQAFCVASVLETT